MMSDLSAKACALTRKDPPSTAAAVVVVAGVLALATVFFFQYVLLILPCHLCLEQRIAYYTAVPLAGLLWLGASHGAARKVLVLGFVVIAGIMLWNAGLSLFHAGVEWKWWQGPTDCSGPINNFGSVGDMMSQLKRISLVRCDEASWRFLGISLAGYDVPLSLGLAAVAVWGAKVSLARPE